MNFFVSEMTFLRYFIPLIKEGNKRGIRSVMYWYPCGKYNCPQKHMDVLKALSKEVGFELKPLTEKITSQEPTFLVEGVGSKNFKGKKIALSFVMDFCNGTYDSCIEDVDHFIFPNKRWTEFEEKPPRADNTIQYLRRPSLFNESKNLYLGSPKYDVYLDKSEIIKKYNLSESKKCFFFYPKSRDLDKIDINKTLNIINELGYEVLIKYRAKDGCNIPNNKNVKVFKDDGWYPHTSMELIYVSDLVVNTDSGGVKECVLLKKPILNFKIKPFDNLVKFLYNEKFHLEIESPIDYNLIKDQLNKLALVKEIDFEETINKYLFKPGASKRILDFLKM